MDLNEVRVFVKVAQAGSFRQAAEQLGMPNSTVSAKVSGLERRLGVTLLQRTTRKLSLTEAGETFFKQSLRGIEEILQAEADVTSSQQTEPQGTLRFTAPVDMGNTCLVDLVTTITKKHPKLTLEFLFTDRVVDLVAEGIDVAIRAGELEDSGLIAKKLGVAVWAPYASAAYLKKHGTPSHPKDLRAHTCLPFLPLGGESWKLSSGKSTVTVPLRKQVVGNDVNLLKALAIGGAGIALLPGFAIHPELSSGKLVRVLPDWTANHDPLHIVYPEQRFMPPKLRAFIQACDTLKI